MSRPAELQPVSAPRLTIVEGSCFVVCGTDGTIRPGAEEGLFDRDTRFLSGWRLTLDDEPPQALSAQPGGPYDVTLLGRHAQRHSLLVQVHRLVGSGLRDDLTLRNLGSEPASCRLGIEVETDLAGMFDVRGGTLPGPVAWRVDGDTLVASGPDGRGVRVRLTAGAGARPDPVRPGHHALTVEIPPRAAWTGTLEVVPVHPEGPAVPAYPLDRPIGAAAPVRSFAAWQADRPRIGGLPDALARTYERTIDDLGALRITASGHTAVAAGAPWFMTLFGRDSLLSAWMALPIAPRLALSTLHALAARQGTRVDPDTEEEPGRILHEVREGGFPLVGRAGTQVYYGSIDSTPLFVMLVGELHRWGVAPDDLAPLLPHVDRALAWIEAYGDKDGDGFVEYERATDHGLENQGWKDSHDSTRYADGRTARAPIALAEVQAYVYGAYVARSELARAYDDEDTVRGWAERAKDLRRRFHEAYWLPERGWFAMALDADKRPVDALTSNLGHCLWTGIVQPEQAARLAELFGSRELSSGWGLRTMSTAMAAYDPVSYHNGSVWPHDTAIGVAGLARYGFADLAGQIARGVLDAATAFGGRLPELYAGFDRAEFPAPVGYPTACSPQAWAAATPLLLLRAALGLEPDLPRGRVRLAGAVPAPLADELGTLEITDLPLGDARVRLRVVDGRPELTGLPNAVTLEHTHGT